MTNKDIWRLAALLLPLSAMAAAGTPERPGCAAPQVLSDGWQISAPKAAGLSSAALCKLVADLRAGVVPNVHAVLIVRHGKLAAEAYFDGMDERRGQEPQMVRFGPEVLHDIRSVSKSVTSLLFGAVLVSGRIRSVDDPVADYLPEYKDLPAAKRLRLRHLLTMTMGQKWDESVSYRSPENSETAMEMAKDRYRYVLSQPFLSEPGAVFAYSGGASALVSKIVERSTGVRIDRYAEQVLFRPLEISRWEWLTYPDGDPIAASGLRMLPRDLAKFGSLYLSGGRWNGRQVVAASWIRESIAPKLKISDQVQYGYFHWRIQKVPYRGQAVQVISTAGNGGQRTFLLPELNTLAVITAGHYNQPASRTLPEDVLLRYLLPALLP